MAFLRPDLPDFVSLDFSPKFATSKEWKIFDDSLDDPVVDLSDSGLLNDPFNKDQETNPYKSSLTFSDLPVDMVGEIMKNLNLRNRLRTRRVCKSVCEAIDSLYAKYKKISILDETNCIVLEFDGWSARYREMDKNKCWMQYAWGHKTVKGNYMNLALNDLRYAMMDRTFELKTLDLSFGNNDTKSDSSARILSLMETASQISKLRVQNLILESNSAEHVMSVLKCLKPGVLKNIELKPDIEFNQSLLESDQFKQAEQVNARFSTYLIPFQIENFYRFHSFSVNVTSIRKEDVVRLRDDLLKVIKFKKCEITLANPVNSMTEIARALGDNVVNRDRWNLRPNEIVHCHPILNSDDILEVSLYCNWIRIEKKPRIIANSE